MISIIVPVYNTEAYVSRCISSLVQQTYREIEIILINDGSTDASGEICVDWAAREDRIIYISKENEGPGAARNLGLQLARSPYVMFVDSDDWCDITLVERMVSAVTRSNVDIVACDLVYVYLNSQHISKLRLPPDQGIEVRKYPDVINRLRASLCGKLFKKQLLLENSIFQPQHYYEDSTVTPLLIALSEKVYRVPIPGYYYFRERHGSIMNTFAPIESVVPCLQTLQHSFESRQIMDKFYSPLKKLCFSILRVGIRHGNRCLEEANQEQFEAIKQKMFYTMNSLFSQWSNIEKDHFCIIGSHFLYRVMQNVVFTDQQICWPYYFSPILGTAYYEDKEKEVETCLSSDDIVIVDFLNDGAILMGGFQGNSSIWQKHCNDLANMLTPNLCKGHVILVRTALAQKNHLGEALDNDACICRANDILTQIYDYFESCCENIKSVSLSDSQFYLSESDDPTDLSEMLCWDASDLVLPYLERESES